MSTTGRWDELFGSGRKWRVLEEATGAVTRGGAVVEFTRGRFEVRTPGWAYASPLSTNLALRGVVLQETEPRRRAVTCPAPGSRSACRRSRSPAATSRPSGEPARAPLVVRAVRGWLPPHHHGLGCPAGRRGGACGLPAAAIP